MSSEVTPLSIEKILKATIASMDNEILQEVKTRNDRTRENA